MQLTTKLVLIGSKLVVKMGSTVQNTHLVVMGIKLATDNAASI